MRLGRRVAIVSPPAWAGRKGVIAEIVTAVGSQTWYLVALPKTKKAAAISIWFREHELARVDKKKSASK